MQVSRKLSWPVVGASLLIARVLGKEELPDLEDDEKIKESVEGTSTFGTDMEGIENAGSPTELPIKTGSIVKTEKGTLKLNTGWRRSTGSDSQVTYNFYWSFEPSKDGNYKPFESTFLFLFAENRHIDEVNACQFTRKKMTADITAHSYNYDRLVRSIWDFDRLGKELTPSE